MKMRKNGGKPWWQRIQSVDELVARGDFGKSFFDDPKEFGFKNHRERLLAYRYAAKRFAGDPRLQDFRIPEKLADLEAWAKDPAEYAARVRQRDAELKAEVRKFLNEYDAKNTQTP